ncbi:hypothetical protein [Catelliglobosispora koreensis]|uniref:hypothetical protein n=1 Tax=Catelliglobosispora koreensis TaxID=129052 RepID=UPI000363447A|nr:hypothetical protein [Catelliglobosispora koreensis]
MSYPPPQQPPFQPQPPVVQKSKATPIIIAILAVVLLVCLGCAGFAAYSLWWAKETAEDIVDNIPTDFPTNFPTGGGTGSTHTVRYEVTGTGKATLIWAEVHVGQGNGEVDLPWSKEFVLDAPNFGAQVIAVPKGADAKPDTCKIFIDGVEKKTAKFSSKTLTCSFVYVSK